MVEQKIIKKKRKPKKKPKKTTDKSMKQTVTQIVKIVMPSAPKVKRRPYYKKKKGFVSPEDSMERQSNKNQYSPLQAIYTPNPNQDQLNQMINSFILSKQSTQRDNNDFFLQKDQERINKQKQDIRNKLMEDSIRKNNAINNNNSQKADPQDNGSVDFSIDEDEEQYEEEEGAGAGFGEMLKPRNPWRGEDPPENAVNPVGRPIGSGGGRNITKKIRQIGDTVRQRNDLRKVFGALKRNTDDEIAERNQGYDADDGTGDEESVESTFI
tara:strand:- start:1840 stop:2643 length:804 start_codon:yes stop_codon:yes gene_type:complete